MIDIGGYLASSAVVAAALAERPGAAAVERAARLVAGALAAGGQVLFCGNGGSAADAQHLAAELMGRLQLERPAYRAVALTTDTSVLTAVGNDYGYADVFARQVEGLGRPGDVLVAISTSGRSENVLRAAARARAKGMAVVAFLGPAASPSTTSPRSPCTSTATSPASSSRATSPSATPCVGGWSSGWRRDERGRRRRGGAPGGPACRVPRPRRDPGRGGRLPARP